MKEFGRCLIYPVRLAERNGWLGIKVSFQLAGKMNF